MSEQNKAESQPSLVTTEHVDSTITGVISLTACVGAVTWWEPENRFRIIRQANPLAGFGMPSVPDRLQQLWVGKTGVSRVGEWRDVEVVMEDPAHLIPSTVPYQF